MKLADSLVANLQITQDIPKEIIALMRSGEAEDISWHNDTMPSVGKELSNGIIVKLWVDYPDPDDRESSNDMQFAVTIAPYAKKGKSSMMHLRLTMSTRP
jgi:hypothetical protein